MKEVPVDCPVRQILEQTAALIKLLSEIAAHCERCLQAQEEKK